MLCDGSSFVEGEEGDGLPDEDSSRSDPSCAREVLCPDSTSFKEIEVSILGDGSSSRVVAAVGSFDCETLPTSNGFRPCGDKRCDSWVGKGVLA